MSTEMGRPQDKRWEIGSWLACCATFKTTLRKKETHVADP